MNPNSSAKIVVIGSFMTDITTFTPHFPLDGQTVFGTHLNLGPGGKSSNSATAAKRAGGNVIMVAKVGQDFLGDFCHSHYEKEGIPQTYIFTSAQTSTGAAVIEVNEKTGENRIIVTPGANQELSAAEVQRAEKEIADCSIVLMQLECNLEAVAEGMRLAKKHCKPVILNPAPAVEISDEFFASADYFTPNETEAAFYSGVTIHDEASALLAGRKLLERGAKHVIITLGRKGAAVITAEAEYIVPTTDLKPVDTTGAGDAFNGGLAVALAEGRPLEEAVKFASCLASIEVTRPGASPAMPKREEIDELLFSFYGIH